MRKRTWSYTDITKSAENGIAISMRLAKKAKLEGDDASASIHRGHAWGQFAAWHDLTAGWQNTGDKERLEASLTDINKEGE